MRKLGAVLVVVVAAMACTPEQGPTDPGSTTTTAPPAPAATAELVSLATASEPADSDSGRMVALSADGNRVLFERTGFCGPLMHDRTAGDTTTILDQSGPTCDFLPSTQVDLAEDGSAFLTRLTDENCSVDAGFSFTFATAHVVVETATGERTAVVPCTPGYYGPVPQIMLPTGAPAAVEEQEGGVVDSAVISEDASSVVVTRTLRELRNGPLDPSLVPVTNPCLPDCHGTIETRQRVLLEAIDVASGVVATISTLIDTGWVATDHNDGAGAIPDVTQVQIVDVSAGVGQVLLQTEDTGASTISFAFGVDVLGLPGDTDDHSDGFLLDVAGGTLTEVTGADASVRALDLSSTGLDAVFTTSTPLEAGDTNGVADIYVYTDGQPTPERVSIGTAGAESNQPSFAARSSISDDGELVAFNSEASTLGCAGDHSTAYVRDRASGTTSAPLRLPAGGPAQLTSGSSSSLSFLAPGAVSISGNGSTLGATTTDWLGDPANDPGVTQDRVWVADPSGPSAC